MKSCDGPRRALRRQAVLRKASSGRRLSRGFAYLVVLFCVALSAAGLAAIGTMWQLEQKRESEKELLFVGNQFRRAIEAYYEASPGVKRYPRDLNELLRDERAPAVRRHLRRLYADPMTGQADWELVRQGDQILGVHSRSQRAATKRASFHGRDAIFEGASIYADWRFIYTPQGAPSAGLAAIAADRKEAASGASAGWISPTYSTAEPAASPDATIDSPDHAAGLPTQETWICTATQASNLQDCDHQHGEGQIKALEACRSAAKRGYRQCLGDATG